MARDVTITVFSYLFRPIIEYRETATVGVGWTVKHRIAESIRKTSDKEYGSTQSLLNLTQAVIPQCVFGIMKNVK